MQCENDLCVYQIDGTCTIDHIHIDHLGMCADCLYPTIEEDVLKQAKTAFLEAHFRQPCSD